MKRNLKALGLALLAICAMSAIAASGASAAGEQFHAGPIGVFVTGHSTEPVLRIGPESTTSGTEVVCGTGTYEGTVQGKDETLTTEQITVHPTYSKSCLIPGVGSVTVDTHGCDFTLTSEYEASGHGKVGLECTLGDVIKVTSALCEIRIAPFSHSTISDGVSYANEGSTIRVSATADEIPYHKTGPFCFLVAGTGHDGFYSDDIIVEGKLVQSAAMNRSTHTWTVDEISEISISHE